MASLGHRGGSTRGRRLPSRRLRRAPLVLACARAAAGLTVGVALLELLDHPADLLLDLGRPFLLRPDPVADLPRDGIHVAVQVALELADAVARHVVEVAGGTAEDDHDLLLHRDGLVLRLL